MSSRGGREIEPTGLKDCRNVIDLLSAYLDSDLSEPQRAEIESHMQVCEPCREFLDSLRKTRDGIRGLRESDIPETCRELLRDVLKKMRSED